MVGASTFQGGLDNDRGLSPWFLWSVSFWGGAGDILRIWLHLQWCRCYFWNDTAGTDTIVFDGATNTNNFRYGVANRWHSTSSSDLHTQAAFSAVAQIVSSLSASPTNRATALFSANGVTLDLQRHKHVFETANAAFTAAFDALVGLTMSNTGATVDPLNQWTSVLQVQSQPSADRF